MFSPDSPKRDGAPRGDVRLNGVSPPPPSDWTTTGAEWDSKAATATSASVTPAVSTGPASSRGSATVRRAGGGSSATKVRKESEKATGAIKTEGVRVWRTSGSLF